MKYQGVLKYNSVFVTDESLLRLQTNGFGAKLFKPIPVSRPHRPQTDTAIGTDANVNANKIEYPCDVDMVTEAEVEADNSVIAYSDNYDDMIIDETDTTTTAVVAATASTEPLQLMLLDEEAYHLFIHGLLALSLMDGTPVTEEGTLWSKFCEKNQKFPLKYKVYTFYRDKDYVVKTGVHYGLDYAIYRCLPSRCHSELCAMVVDATKPYDIEETFESTACQQGWRHLSTLTRVMPDVTKLMTICYVLPIDDYQTEDVASTPHHTHSVPSSSSLSATSPGVAATPNPEAPPQPSVTALNTVIPPLELDKIFDGIGHMKTKPIDFSTPACLQQLQVRPITMHIRRIVAKAENYSTIGDVQAKYRQGSILKAPRTERSSKKKRRKRRDHTTVRAKVTSKHNKMWKALAKKSTHVVTTSSSSDTKRTHEHNQNKKDKRKRDSVDDDAKVDKDDIPTVAVTVTAEDESIGISALSQVVNHIVDCQQSTHSPTAATDDTTATVINPTAVTTTVNDADTVTTTASISISSCKPSNGNHSADSSGSEYLENMMLIAVPLAATPLRKSKRLRS